MTDSPDLEDFEDIDSDSPFRREPSPEIERQPEGRLCRVVNVAGGTVLDERVIGTGSFIVGSRAASATVKYWRLVQLGPAYAFRTEGDIAMPRYLAPTNGGPNEGQLLTISTFPCFWDLDKTDNYATDPSRTSPGVLEEWTCAIKWPFQHNPNVLDSERGGHGAKIQLRPFHHPPRKSQFWRIQFLDEHALPRDFQDEPNLTPEESEEESGLRNGAKYIIQSVRDNNVVDWALLGKRVLVWERHGGDNQIWEAIDKGHGWAFKNQKSKQYLSFDSGPGNGIKVTVEPSDVTLWTPQQRGFEREHGENVYRLVLRNTDYSLSVGAFELFYFGTPVVLWKTEDVSTQIWKFEEV